MGTKKGDNKRDNKRDTKVKNQKRREVLRGVRQKIPKFNGFTERELKRPYGLFTFRPRAKANEVAMTGEWTKVQVKMGLTIDLAGALDTANWTQIINYAAARRFKEATHAQVARN